MTISHLPTFMLLIGYVVYWIELFFLDNPQGHTSPLAWILWISAVLFVFWKKQNVVRSIFQSFKRWALQLRGGDKLFISSCALLTLGILGVALFAALQPPHLIQETDALNYHIGIPRQHLMRGTFAHISWSSADLYLLPLDYSLAPYWLSTSLPNKIPQYFFVLGLLLISGQMSYRLTRNKNTIVITGVAILASHIVGIQLGSAMLDLVMAYVFMAALDSFMRKHYFLFALEAAFYVWSKSFIPLQMILFVFLFGILFLILNRWGVQSVGWGFDDKLESNFKLSLLKSLRKVSGIFILLSLLIGGPFVFKSMYYTGTPLYPLLPFRFMQGVYGEEDSPMRDAVLKTSGLAVTAKDVYGGGRSAKDWVEHFWYIAVPEKGVNNRFDYPVGLVYLLFLGPFVWEMMRSMQRRHISLFGWSVIFFWSIWWIGSQQTRFLYIPLILMYLSVGTRKDYVTRIFQCVLLFAFLLTFLSVVRAHKRDFTKASRSMLRAKDQALVSMTQENTTGSERVLDHAEIAYAGFPVHVEKGHPYFVFQSTRAMHAIHK